MLSNMFERWRNADTPYLIACGAMALSLMVMMCGNFPVIVYLLNIAIGGFWGRALMGCTQSAWRNWRGTVEVSPAPLPSFVRSSQRTKPRRAKTALVLCAVGTLTGAVGGYAATAGLEKVAVYCKLAPSRGAR